MNIRNDQYTIILLLLFFPSLGISQVEFFGYMETEYDWMEVKESTYAFGYNKLRLDYESFPAEEVSIRGNINFQTYHGQTIWEAFDFLPFDSLNIDGETVHSMPISFLDSIYMDNLYINAAFPRFDVTLGRQPISLGTGYAWNPLDIFNQKELVDPTYEQPGVHAVRLEYYINEKCIVDFILSPDTNFTQPSGMIQVKSNVASFDYSVNVARKNHLYPFWEDEDAVSTHRETSFIGGSFTGEISEYGMWGEALWSLSSNNSAGDVSYGLDHTFNNGLYVMLEGYHNSLGAEKDGLYDFHYLNYFSGETKSLMQNYLFSLLSKQINEYVSCSVFIFGNLDDNSFMYAPQLSWEILQDVSLSAFTAFSSGDADSEFGIQNQSFRVRMRAYF